MWNSVLQRSPHSYQLYMSNAIKFLVLHIYAFLSQTYNFLAQYSNQLDFHDFDFFLFNLLNIRNLFLTKRIYSAILFLSRLLNVIKKKLKCAMSIIRTEKSWKTFFLFFWGKKNKRCGSFNKKIKYYFFIKRVVGIYILNSRAI